MQVSAINGVNPNWSCNASYPKYLKEQNRTGLVTGLIGTVVGTGTLAHYFVNGAKATKHPIIKLAVGIVGTLVGFLGLNKATTADIELRKLNNIVPQDHVLYDEEKIKKIFPNGAPNQAKAPENLNCHYVA